MSLQTILEGMPKEQKLPFLRKAYLPERQDVAETLANELYLGLRHGAYKMETRREFEEVMRNLIQQAEVSGDKEKVGQLRLQQITSYFYAHDIESAAKNSGDPELVAKVVEHYRKEYFNKAEMVISLLEYLGRKEEAREYSLEAAKALRECNGGFTSSGIYLSLGMKEEAREVLLENGNFNEAIQLAQESLNAEELPRFYKKVFGLAKGKGYNSGFSVQVKVAKLLGDEKLERTTKKKYVDWIMKESKSGYWAGDAHLDLIREVGNKEQLRKMHERIIKALQQGFFSLPGIPESGVDRQVLAEAAGEAYKDTGEIKYAKLALETYEKMGEFPRALEFAKIADPKKAKGLEEIVSLLAA